MVEFPGPGTFKICGFSFRKHKTLVKPTFVLVFRKKITIPGSYYFVSSYKNDCTRKIRPIKLTVEAR